MRRSVEDAVAIEPRDLALGAEEREDPLEPFDLRGAARDDPHRGAVVVVIEEQPRWRAERAAAPLIERHAPLSGRDPASIGRPATAPIIVSTRRREGPSVIALLLRARLPCAPRRAAGRHARRNRS